MQTTLIQEGNHYQVLSYCFIPNSSYPLTKSNAAIHWTFVKGRASVQIDKEVFEDVEAGEVFHIQPGELHSISNIDPFEDCIVIVVKFFTNLDTISVEEENVSIDFSSMDLRSFRLIGFNEQNEVSETTEVIEVSEATEAIETSETIEDEEVKNNEEDPMFKCKYC